MKALKLSWMVIWLYCAAASPFARADAVLDWNEIALSSVVASKQPAPNTTRGMAMVQVAIFDAVNLTDPRFLPYAAKSRPVPGASSEAAAAAASRAVLLKLFPEQRDTIDKAYAAAMASIAESAEKAAGMALGEQAAADLLKAREGDGIGAPNTYRPRTAAGVYVATPLPIGSDFAVSRPWVLARPDEFRPVPPPDLSSQTWVRDYNEIRSIGGKSSTRRTAEQTAIAQFWVITGAPAFNPIVRYFASTKLERPVDRARLFALAYLAAADSLVAVFDAKYAYNFWRPITAIRNGDLGGNADTPPDPSWLPLIDTPLHPEYPCAHCINAGAVGAVLEKLFPSADLTGFTMSSPTAPGTTRSWERLSDLVEEVSNARVWSGVHYRNSTQVGTRMGKQIGERTVERFLTRNS